LLALETSTDACSVALECDGEVFSEHHIAPQKHAQLLLPMIEKLLSNAGLKPADLDGVAFGCGPGSFTGVRIAAATTQGIAFGSEIGVIPVSSLHALAQGVHRVHKASHVLASFDARMSEVYWGAYVLDDAGIVQSVLDDRVCSPEQVPMPADAHLSHWSLVGSGADQYSDVLPTAFGDSVHHTHIIDCWPNALDVLSVAKPIAETGGFLMAAEAVPVYLRDRVALTEVERANGEQL